MNNEKLPAGMAFNPDTQHFSLKKTFKDIKQVGDSWDGSGIGDNSPHNYLWYCENNIWFPIMPKIPFPKPTTNAQTNLIEAQMALLLEMAEDPEMGVNQVGWINDDLDFIEVAYNRNSPDGDRQQEYADEIAKGETQYIDFKEAMYLLNTRIENSL